MVHLIREEDYDILPLDPSLRWLTLEEICRKNLRQYSGEGYGISSGPSLRLEYMMTVSSAAEELGVQGIRFPSSNEPLEAFDDFFLSVTSVATKIRLQNAGSRDPNTVALSDRGRAQITTQVRKLRQIISGSELSEEQKSRALSKLGELSQELEKPRLRLSTSMAAIGTVAAVVAVGTSFLADAPNAISTITSVIGAEKEDEDREVKRVSGPQQTRLLEGPRDEEEEDNELPF